MSSHVFSSDATLKPKHYLETVKYWSIISAYGLAAAEGIRLTQEHIDILYWLRKQFDEFGDVDATETIVQLAVMYGPYGGEAYLHTLFPKGPIVQSMMRIAGLPIPEDTQETYSLAS